ncbi:MAG TPA: hypothetical protein PK280_21515 [Planctomycetota bacterium]|nr:hypothetical protein [Planctomycetota bacterium]
MSKAFTTRRDLTRQAILDRVNDEFDLELGADQFDGATAAGLAACVVQLAGAEDNGHPVYDRALADVRRLLCLHLNLPEGAILADTRLETLLTDEKLVGQVWEKLRCRLGQDLPALEFMRWAKVISVVLASCAALGMLVWFPFFLGRIRRVDLLRILGEEGIAVITLAAMAGAAFLTFRGSLWGTSLVSPRRIPASCRTVSSLALCGLASAQPARDAAGRIAWTRELVETKVFATVAKENRLTFLAVASDPEETRL